MQLLQHLAEHAQRRPLALAVHAHGPCAAAPLTYDGLWSAARALAAVIADTVPPGRCVLLSCANRPEFVIAFLGILAAGRTVFPIHPRLTPAEVRDAARSAGAGAIIGEPAARDAMAAIDVAAIDAASLRALVDTGDGFGRRGNGNSAGEPGLMLQSSGTTGLPKIVYRDGPSLDAVAANVAAATGLGPEDRVLGAVPIGHSYGVENILLGPIWAGACAHLCDGFDVPVVTAMLRAPHGVTVMPGSAFMFEMLGRLNSPGPTSLRLAYSAGSPLPERAAREFAQRLGIIPGQLYGATEVGSVTFNDPGPPGRTPAGFDPLSVGLPMRGVRVMLDPTVRNAAEGGAGEGHILIHAPSMLSCYVGEPASPLVERNGMQWFPTGDLGHIDAQGRLAITGRLKLLIDVGGVKVNPLEVEQVLCEHPDVGRCVVVPIAISETVSRIKAVITPRAAGADVDVEGLRALARERLAGYKVPRVFEVRESLPLSPAGKVLRWRLAEAAS